MTKVNVKTDLLKWAIDRIGDPTIVESKFPDLPNWLNGSKKPTLKQLENFANTTSTPLGYFFLSNPPNEELSIPSYRTVGDNQNFNPSPDLIETIRTMERRQQWMRDYLIETGNEPLNFVGVSKSDKNPEYIANLMREEMNLENNWASKRGTWRDALNDLLQTIQDIGILVMINGIVGNNTKRKLSVNEFRGFVLMDNYAPLVFINGSDGKAAQMFTLAHELAHIWIGESAIFDLDMLQPAEVETEKLCNQIAAEFLVPKKDLLEYWNTIIHEDDRFQRIARYFKVSELVAIRRAWDLNLITYDEYQQFYKKRELLEHAGTTNGGGNFYNNANWRIGPKFADALISQVQEGKVLYRDAYKLTGIKGITFNKFIKHRSENRGRI